MDEKFHLFSDGSCDLPPELTREKNITVVPFYVSFGDEPYQKEIKEIEKKYKDEETAVKKQAEIIRNDFFKAVFE